MTGQPPITPTLRTVEPEHRRTHQPVRRNSRMAGDEGRFWRRYHRQEMGPALKAAERYDLVHKQPGQRNGPLGHVGLQVFRALWKRVRFADGRLDPSIAWIMRTCRRSKDAVVEALKKLRAHGFLAWLRRFVPAEEAGQGRRGPQVKQTSNAYALSVPKKAMALLRAALLPADQLVRQDERADQVKAFERQASADTPLGSALDRLGEAVMNAIPASGMNPPPRIS